MMIVLMGVSGCGKTTIGKKLSEAMGIPFYDADDFHPKSNIERMRNNIPLTDEDRYPWLKILASNIQQWEGSGGGIVACSALKESYRKILASKALNIFWVYLSGSFELIENRLKERAGHYMKSTLLKSQFDTLEVPDYGLHINIEKSTDEIVHDIILKIKSNA